MKFKKIITVFFIITFMFINININVNAAVLDYNFTNTYQNPLRTTQMINASTYLYYNAYNSSRPLNSAIRFVIITDKHPSYPNYYIYNQVILNFNIEDLQIKKYNGYTYLMGKNYYFEYRYLLQEKNNYSLSLSGGTSSSSPSSSSFFIKFNNSSLNYRLSNQSGVTNIDEYIISDLSNTIVYDDKIYDKFLELNSTFPINGETFINNADIENPRYFGITLVDKQKFIDWIIENQKYLVFSDYGISTAVNYVDDIINLYEEFNSSPLKFFTSIPGFLISNGSIFANVDKAKELYNLIDTLYQEFKISQQQKVFEVGNNNNLLPHQRINPNTDNPIYIEDINDTLDIKLLREILKTLIQTPNIIYDLFDYYLFNISSNVSLIADYISQLPSYLTELLYYRFAPLFSDSGSDTSELQDFLLYLFNPTYDSFDEIDLVLKDKFDLTELEQFLLLEENLNDNLLNENDTELIPLNTVGDGGEGGTQTIYPSFKFTLPISNLTKVPLELKLIDFDKFSIAITAFKGIFSVVIIFFFIRWLIRFFPKVLSGY